MDCAALNMASSSIVFAVISSPKFNLKKPKSLLCYGYGFQSKGSKESVGKILASVSNDSASAASHEVNSSSVGNWRTRRSSLESLFCYDKPIPEERIEKPVGISMSQRVIGDNPQCTDCGAKGAVLCTTCSGSGLYVDSIMESQGIIVKVRCLGCGGTGNIMCSECGGLGHLGRHK